ncbi:uncharacterized protein LOC131017197 [Salvia miltiorrhiza]|uniref:uncharacterized protein LOC131017197 n=1 Tax=Salvia miltiorrhiza TaxID=226208 RepID=UPI0025AD5A87|nr:uncharacterized protein LOC131017197 [Salvia miltiorrhiza]
MAGNKSSGGIAPQSWFLYPGKWTRAMDARLMRYIIRNAFACKYEPPHKSRHALEAARDEVNRYYEVDFDLEAIIERVSFLEERYITYRSLIYHPEMKYDLEENRVHASDDVWRRLFKEKIFNQAYFYAGDPEYYKLSILFGGNGKHWIGRPPVMASYGSPSDSPMEESGPFLSSSDSEEEVTSKDPNAHQTTTKDAGKSQVSAAAPIEAHGRVVTRGECGSSVGSYAPH